MLASVAYAVLMALRYVPPAGGGAGATFDYYISTSGSDSNTGTDINHPWAITAINTKQATYSGKRLGLLPGTYDVSGSMLSTDGGGNPQVVLNINGGTSSNSTYIGSSDSNGNYLRGTAILDAAARTSFTATIGTSASATFDISMTAGSTTATLTNITGTPQVGMLVTGGTYGPVWLISGSAGTWTTSFKPSVNWSTTGVTAYVATMTVSGVTGAALGAGAVLTVPGLAAGALITSGSGTSWTIGANVTSTITGASGSSILYGGRYDSASWIMGQSSYPSFPTNKGYWTVDGLVFTGFAQWAISIGSYDASGGALSGVLIQNCEMHGGNATYNCRSQGSNLAAFVNFTSINATITQNYLHNNIGWSDDQHYSGMYIWGLGTGKTSGITVTYNTLVGTGNLHQKEASVWNSEVAYNYVDMTGSSPLSITGQNGACLAGWGADGNNGTLTRIHHNVLISPSMQYLWLTNDTGQTGWYTPGQIYNNTCVAAGNQYAGGAACFVFFEMTTGSKVCTYYNNLFYDNGYAAATNYGYVLVNLDVYNIGDYNLYGTGNSFTTIPNGQQGGGEVNHTFSGYQTAVSAESHSPTPTSTNPFTNTGTFADQYHVQSGSPAYNVGKIGGVVGGAATNIGAWDGSGRPGASWVS